MNSTISNLNISRSIWLSNLPPTLTLNGADTMVVGQNTTFTDPGATAADSGVDVTSSIITTGTVDTTTLGTYTKMYTYTDAGGLFATQVRTVVVVPASLAQPTEAEVTDYYPYGSQRFDTGSYNSQRKYIGEYYDTSADLSFLNARYYNGGTGQFTSQDPVFWEVGMTRDGVQALIQPQSQNSYLYAFGNPLTYTDKNGRYGAFAYYALMGLEALWIYQASQKFDYYRQTGTLPKNSTDILQVTPIPVGGAFNQVRREVNAVNATKTVAVEIRTVERDMLPKHVRESLEQYEANGWTNQARTTGTKVGRTYRNEEGLLPKGVTYKEYDVNSKVSGKDRDAERFIRDSNGKVYYTNNHYGEGRATSGFGSINNAFIQVAPK